jgi:alpha-glucuronidase
MRKRNRMTETRCDFSISQRSFKLHNVIIQCKRNLAVQLQKVPSVVYGMFKHIHVIQRTKLVSNLRDMKQEM